MTYANTKTNKKEKIKKVCKKFGGIKKARIFVSRK
jgi:hypothetical protein